MQAPKNISLAQGRTQGGYYFLPSSVAPMAGAPSRRAAFDVEAVRRDFPILGQKVHGKPLVWLDNGATSQKPAAVIDAVSDFYRNDNSNVHRAAHALAARATEAYEGARETARAFLGARSAREIVFVRGTTEAINLVAQSWGRANLRAGDEIVLTEMEHHANIVPWQMLAQDVDAVIRVAPTDDRGDVDLLAYQALLCHRTRLVSLTQVSNVLGTVNPVPVMAAMAKAVGARVMVDGAQSAPHFPVDVQAMGADWFALSGHKLFGPTGVGVLYGREDILEAMPPWQGGGNMIRDVTFQKTEYADLPAKFEAGTGILAGAVGLGAAMRYLDRIDHAAAAAHEADLLAHATELLEPLPGLRIIGTSPTKVGVLSFTVNGLAPEVIGQALDAEGIAVRSGHHCAQPILRRHGLEACVRASFAFYNTHAEVEALARVVRAATAKTTSDGFGRGPVLHGR